MEAPGLAMSRSLGDKAGRDLGVISEPDVYEIILKEEDKFIVIASDGVWEFFTNADVQIPFKSCFTRYILLLKGCQNSYTIL